MRLPILAASLVLCISGATAPSAAPQSVAGQALSYQIYAGGFHAVSFEARLERDKQSYKARVQAKTDGFIASLFDFSMMSEVAGLAGDSGLAPERFKTAAKWQERPERSVEILYGPGDNKTVRAVPPAEQDERPEVPDWLQADTLDPLSASLAIMEQVRDTQSCTAEVAIFDGRRRFDMTATDLGMVELAPSSYSSYAGPALKCRVELERVTGFWQPQRADQRRYPLVVTVFLAEAVDGGQAVPVRIEGRQSFGAFRIHLVDAKPLSAPVL